jgi:undecaprenyl-diphosphatase
VTVLYAALLGVVQGLTEFLPISSSAHLILARAVLGWNAEAFGLAFDVACHVGTLLAVLAFFRLDLRGMASALARPFEAGDGARRLRLVVIGTLPIVFVGLLWADLIEARLRTPAVSVVMLAVGAAGLLLAERLGTRRRGEADLGYGDALLLGMAQASALVPGVSRSGATIAVGMFAGLRREAAARFSFLLGVPAVFGAAVREGRALAAVSLEGDTALLFVVGLLSAAGVGYLTIKYFLAYLGAHRLDVFAYYRLGLAVVAAGWLFFG